MAEGAEMKTLDTTLTFRCPRFKPTAGELDEQDAEFINPGLFARQAATYLAVRMAEQGTNVRGVTTEDCGCWVEIENPDKYFLAVGVANYDGDTIGSFETETHRVFIEPNKTPVSRWFKRIDTEERVMQLLSQVRQILEADGDITEIKAGGM
jgi:hypothetical protein